MFAQTFVALLALWPAWIPMHAMMSERPRVSEAPRPPCVTFSTEARFVGYAYNHIVHVANGCNAAKSCMVSTDVNPEPQAVTVPSSSTVQVVTFIGSPASAFTADVRCSS